MLVFVATVLLGQDSDLLGTVDKLRILLRDDVGQSDIRTCSRRDDGVESALFRKSPFTLVNPDAVRRTSITSAASPASRIVKFLAKPIDGACLRRIDRA